MASAIFLYPSSFGCPLDPFRQGFIASWIGETRLAEVLSKVGASWSKCCEASRWFVAPEFRSLGLGPRVVAATWLFAIHLNMGAALVLAATRHGQDQLLSRMGATPVEGVPLIPAVAIAEEMLLLWFDLRYPPPKILTRQMDATLDTTCGLVLLAPR